MNEIEKSEFSKSILFGTYDLETLEPIDHPVGLKFLGAEVDELLELNDPTTLSTRHNWLKIPGTSENDFMEKVFEIENQRRFIAGIRHVGGNPSLPFVNITPNFTPSSWNDVNAIKDIVLAEFNAFKPKHLALWLSPSSLFAKELEHSVQPARRYLAGKTAQLISQPLPLNFESLSIEPIEDPDYYQWIKNEYDLFHDKQPELKSWVTIPDLEEFEDYRAQHLLYRAKINDKTIGVIGGQSEPLLGMVGLYMGNILIAEEFKGKSLATAMQRKFIEMVGKSFEVVWGTIDARNIPSTKAALKIGLRAVRAEYFIPLI